MMEDIIAPESHLIFLLRIAATNSDRRFPGETENTRTSQSEVRLAFARAEVAGSSQVSSQNPLAKPAAPSALQRNDSHANQQERRDPHNRPQDHSLKQRTHADLLECGARDPRANQVQSNG